MNYDDLPPNMRAIAITLPIELTNGNDGRGSKWFSSAKMRKEIEATLRALRMTRDEPIPYQCVNTVTRILGKGQRLWDSSSIGRGNWKEIEDAMVACGWWVDDSLKYIAQTIFMQDDTRREIGPCVELVISEYKEANAAKTGKD